MKIIIYRDGVGDGQLDMVANYEVDQLYQVLKTFRDDYHPNISVVIVQKRINTRIFVKMVREIYTPVYVTIPMHLFILPIMSHTHAHRHTQLAKLCTNTRN